jgi:hypothetical protein
MPRTPVIEPEDGLSQEEWQQLINHIFDRAQAALTSNQRSQYREVLEEISDLCDPDTNLTFNDDGTVEIDESDDEDLSDDDED